MHKRINLIFVDQCSILRQDTKVNPETHTNLFRIIKVALHVNKQQTSIIDRTIYKKWPKEK